MNSKFSAGLEKDLRDQPFIKQECPTLSDHIRTDIKDKLFFEVSKNVEIKRREQSFPKEGKLHFQTRAQILFLMHLQRGKFLASVATQDSKMKSNTSRYSCTG